MFRLRHASVANARSKSTVWKHEHRSKKEKKKVNWWEFCRNISCSWPDDGQCVREQGWFTKLHPYSHGSGECANYIILGLRFCEVFCADKALTRPTLWTPQKLHVHLLTLLWFEPYTGLMTNLKCFRRCWLVIAQNGATFPGYLREE